ncbi:hypothetical protein, partial [Streptomyces sp. PAL114]|uniref:hypothetical protein n=1 Tax=Streptomyces sp. PAL114 TaxID=2970893 RepID=UPI0028FD69BE
PGVGALDDYMNERSLSNGWMVAQAQVVGLGGVHNGPPIFLTVRSVYRTFVEADGSRPFC